MIGRTNVSGGGLDINGIIERYIAGGEILAGDFVTNTDNYTTNVGTNIELVNDVHNSNKGNAIKINDNQILLLYTLSSNNLYAKVLTIENDNITSGTPVQIDNNVISLDGEQGVPIIKVSENKFLVVYCTTSLYGKYLTIQNDVISVSTATQLDTITTTISSSNRYYTACKTNENHIAVLYGSGGSTTNYLYFRSAEINGTTIVPYSGTSLLSNNQYACYYCHVENMDNNYIIYNYRAKYNSSNNATGVGIIRTKDNGEIDLYNGNNIVTGGPSSYSSTRFEILDTENCIMELDSYSKVVGRKDADFINDSSYYGKDHTNHANDIVKIDINIVVYLYNNGTFSICKIIAGVPVSLKNFVVTSYFAGFRGIMLTPDKMFCYHVNQNRRYNLYANILTLSSPITNVYLENKSIKGLAKNSGSTGNIVEIYKLNNSEA